MVTIESSKDGRRVIRKDGKLLASSIDPIREAKIWAERAVALMGDCKTLAVLGLACGYHVEALLSMRPETSLVIIERDQEVADRALELCPTLPLQSLVIEAQWQKVADSGLICDMLGAVFKIAVHGPSLLAEREYYSSVESFLIGRERVSFLMQLRGRPELFALMEPEAIAQFSDQTTQFSDQTTQQKTDQVVSIKTLQGLFKKNLAHSRERRLWQTLEELVR